MPVAVFSNISQLIAIAEGLHDIVPGIRLYLFGSVLAENSDPSDIDVLITYPSGLLMIAHQLATHIRETTGFPPYDVIVLSSEEERETDFISTVSARLFWESGE
jgi:predicted nucleotidyltransferase